MKHARENRPVFTLLVAKLNTKDAWVFHLEKQKLKNNNNKKNKPNTKKQNQKHTRHKSFRATFTCLDTEVSLITEQFRVFQTQVSPCNRVRLFPQTYTTTSR